MDALLRERRQPGATAEYQDREVTGGIITIGSAPDQTIQLLGAGIAPRHAVLAQRSGAVSIRCLRGRRIEVNGKPVRSATLAEGDRVELAGHVLEVIAAPAGFDVGIQITPNDAVQSSAFEAAYQTQVGQALGSKRVLAWLLTAVVLLGGLAAPLYFLRVGGDGGARGWPIDDRLWSTGALLPAHELTIGDDCSTCHVELFERVRDEQCTACHGSVLDHVSAPVEAVVGSDRCATCHREHNDPRHFVMRRDELCSSCHARTGDFPPEVDIEAVLGFAASTHPPFDVHLLVPVSEPVGNLLSFDWTYRIESGETAEEQSNLKFPHDVHLDETKVQSLVDGSGLGCADCHTLSSDREHFLPIEMERHCRNCHDLKFDLSAPTRELPHGEPAEVIFALEGHFLRRYGDPEAAERAEPRRRLPDRAASADVCSGSAFDCAMTQTIEEVANQFGRRGCVTCHVVEDNGSADIFERFQVHPVRLQSDYYPASRFPHARHQTQGEAASDAACLTCHAASTARASGELLIPGIDNCLGCHGDRATRDRVALNCVSCHTYHPAARLDAAVSAGP